MINTRVYIDGFNLYHAIIREKQLHWLNLEEMSRRLNLGVPVQHVTYCTARMPSSPHDPQKAQRQDAYLRALAAHSQSTTILLGDFRTEKKHRPIVGCRHNRDGHDRACVLRVVERTEKGSDVNLAVRLIHDAHLGRFDRAIVVSGDSDLAEPIHLAVSELGREVWVRNPRRRSSAELAAVASDYGTVSVKTVAKSQLPDPVVVGQRQYQKPEKWRRAPLAKVERRLITAFECDEAECSHKFCTHRFDPIAAPQPANSASS